MARACQIAKLNRISKFSTRHRNRCKVCGLRGEVPGLLKASW
jgi:small subunit ribosomal protein S14